MIAHMGTLPRNLGCFIPPHVDRQRIGLIDHRPGGRRWTLGSLAAGAQAIGASLLSRGLRRGNRIAIVAENSAESYLAYVGAMQAGLVAVPVNYRLPAETVAYILRDSDIRLAIIDMAFAPLIPASVPRVILEEEAADMLRSAPLDAVTPEPGEIAEILYTSGSTGRPKGVPLSHDGQAWALSVHLLTAPVSDARTVVVAPLYHMNAIFNVAVSLWNGMQVIMMPRFDARAWLEAVAEHRCTMLSGIPSMFALAARETDLIDRLDLSSVTRVFLGSAPLTDAMVRRVLAIFPMATLNNGYGTTEAGPSVFGAHPQGLARPMLSVGYPIPDIEWRLTGGDTPDQGVLELRTPAVMPGYLNLPAATAERLSDGWYATGDIMRRDGQGFFYFVGRADDMFVCGGENVYPGEAEKMIERHPDVLQAAVVAVPDDIKGHIPIAFVVPVPGRTPSPDDLKAFALREGPGFSHPRAFVVIDALPVAGTHKIDKRPLMPRALEIMRALGRDQPVRVP